jgi:hypothetical protein
MMSGEKAKLAKMAQSEMKENVAYRKLAMAAVAAKIMALAKINGGGNGVISMAALSNGYLHVWHRNVK